MTRPIVIASLICVLGAAPAAAQPQPPPPQPQPQPPQPQPAEPSSESPAELFAIGKRHYDLAEYRPAIAAWKRAYLLSNEPLLLFNIAQAYRLSGDCAQANRFYFNYQRLVPKPANRLELEEAMAKCHGVEPATADTAEPGPTGPGPTGPVDPPRTPETPPEVPTVDRGRNLRLAGISTAAAGGAVGIVSLVFGLSARSKASEIEGKPRNTQWSPELVELARDGEAAQGRARVFAVISVAAIATGATLWVIGRSRSKMRIDVAAGAGQGEVSLSCVF